MVSGNIDGCGAAYANDNNVSHNMFPTGQLTKDANNATTNDPQYCWKPAGTDCGNIACTQT